MNAEAALLIASGVFGGLVLVAVAITLVAWRKVSTDARANVRVHVERVHGRGLAATAEDRREIRLTVPHPIFSRGEEIVFVGLRREDVRRPVVVEEIRITKATVFKARGVEQ